MVIESDSESGSIPPIEDLEEPSSRAAPNERAAPSLSESPVAIGKRPRGRPRKNSSGTPSPLPAKTSPYIKSSQSSPLNKPRRGRPRRSALPQSPIARTVAQSPMAAKRITRLAAGQNNISAPKASKSEQQEPADQMLLALGLKKVNAPASSKPGASQISLPIAQLRSLAFDLFFASVPDPDSVSFIHSLLPPGVEQLTPEKVFE